MKFIKYMASITLSGAEKTVTFKKGFGYLKPSLKWIRQWTIRETFRFADVYDVDRQSPAWNIRDGLLLEYRTVKPEDCPTAVLPRPITSIINLRRNAA